MHYEKLIYDLRGDAHVDRWAPNHKITSNFFNFAITQENQYLLGNGAIFGDKKTKENWAADRANFTAGLMISIISCRRSANLL